MRKILSIALMLVALSCFGQGKRYSDYPSTVTVSNGWLFLVAQPGVTNFSITYSNLQRQLSGGSTNGAVLNFYVTSNYVTFQYVTNQYVTTNYTYLAYITNLFTTNLTVNTSYTTNQFVTTNNTFIAYITNLYTTNLIAGTANITNLTVENFYANNAIFTNVYTGHTNHLLGTDGAGRMTSFNRTNGVALVTSVDLTTPYAFTNHTANFTITGFTAASVDLSNTNVQWATLFYTNNSSGAKTITLPADWQDLGSKGNPVYNTNIGCLSVMRWPNGFTNYLWVGR